MCNNCINKTDGIPDPEDVLNDLASDITTKGFVKFRDAIGAMKHYASSASSKLRSDNAELRLQVSALTQALETQSRENHPYIKEMEDKRDFYKENYEYMQRMYSPVGDALHKAVPLLKRALNTKGLPEGLHDDISNFLSNLKDAPGGDKPEQEQ